MKIGAALVMLCLSRLAVAGELTLDRTCVEIDPVADVLAEPDRTRATELMRRVLEREDLLVVTSDCTETYSLSHEKINNDYVIRVRSSAGKRRMTVPTLIELTSKYEKMVRSLIEAKAVVQAGPELGDGSASTAPQPQVAAAALSDGTEPWPTASATDDSLASSADPAPYKRNLWYVTAGAQLLGGGAFSLGYRRQFTSSALDIAYNARSSDGAGLDGSTLSAKLLGTTRASERLQLYLGGGLSAGSISRGNDYYYGHEHYWGEGLSGELTTGMRFGGSKGVQFLTQLDITLPFFRMGNDEGMKDWAGAAVLSGGIGF